MHLKMTMTNTSDHDLRFTVRVLQAKDLNYAPVNARQVDIQLLDSKGHFVPLTPYGRAVRGQCGECGGGGTLGDLRPGESLNEEVDLSREFDITKPGRYTVRAQQLDEASKLQVRSDPVTVTLKKYGR